MDSFAAHLRIFITISFQLLSLSHNIRCYYNKYTPILVVITSYIILGRREYCYSDLQFFFILLFSDY
jgi:hypothetical protein